LQGRAKKNLAQKALALVGTGTPPYLSIEGGRFTFVDAAGNTMPVQTLYVDVVFVDFNEHVSKIWYGSSYDPSNPLPPQCWSDNGIGPSVGAASPQNNLCGSCPKNVWGSKISQLGSKVKECTDKIKSALIVPGWPEHVFQLQIPPGSFINWRAYTARFATQDTDLNDVITRISFAEANILGFEAVNYIDDATVAHQAKLDESGLTNTLVGRFDRPRDGLPAPAPQAALAPPAPAPQVVQPAPFQPSAPPPAAPLQGQVMPPAAPPAAAPAPQAPARRGRGRPAASAPVAGTPAPFAPAAGTPGPAFGAAPTATSQPAQPFGIGGAVAANPEVTNALSSVFGRLA
jgi:hypothetical protein